MGGGPEGSNIVPLPREDFRLIVITVTDKSLALEVDEEPAS